ncbi:MAG: AAA family ATPase [Planctomycetota bacterium]
MIESIEFKNFKVLRDATLPLGPCTILVGPNGSGKTTVLQALEVASGKVNYDFQDIVAAEAPGRQDAVVEIRFNWGEPHPCVSWFARWDSRNHRTAGRDDDIGPVHPEEIQGIVGGARVFSFDAAAIATPAIIGGATELDRPGSRLAAVLDGLRDHAPERFNAINAEIGRWLPEFDQVLFDPSEGRKAIALRTRRGHHKIPGRHLSQGTLISLAILTLAHLPEPPTLIGLEEPDRGIHPRLLRHVKDALHRLSHPEACGEEREPVQVIATTHCPYFLDLFKPEDIVIANRLGDDVRFERLSEQPYIDEVLGDAPLGEAWYTGVLGGVPSEP